MLCITKITKLIYPMSKLESRKRYFHMRDSWLIFAENTITKITFIFFSFVKKFHFRPLHNKNNGMIKNVVKQFKIFDLVCFDILS